MRKFHVMKQLHQPQAHQRGGTTLTEVLMAILCFGIGVVAVASLFPVALLRSVQATQLTQGTILRFNAETLIDLNANIVLNPDGIDNMGLPGGAVDEHFNSEYLVDPLGWNIATLDGGTPNAVGNMSRFNLQLTSEAAAESIVTLPDSWVRFETVPEFPTANTLNSVTLDGPIPTDVFDTFDSFDADMDGEIEASEVSNQPLRIIIFSQSGQLSESRIIRERSQMSGSTITWPTTGANAQPPLPNNGQYYDNLATRVMLEVRERRYTWLLSVRNVTSSAAIPQALVDVVIFFRRSPSIQDETVYQLSGSGRTYTVTKPTMGLADPFLKKGGFMLDTDTGTWHRLADVKDGATPTITVERNVSTTLNNHNVVFMRGVVEVYSLGAKP